MQDRDQLIQLLSDCGDGRRDAFHRLYDLTSAKLFGSAVYLLREKNLAEEALQECFVHIWYKASEYQADKGHPFSWMVTILRNRCLDILRREKRHQEKINAVEFELGDLPDLDEAASNELSELSNLELQLLNECLQQLNEEQRESLLMAYYFGYSHSEIVDKFNRPLGTVKSWIRRAMQSVRECIEQ